MVRTLGRLSCTLGFPEVSLLSVSGTLLLQIIQNFKKFGLVYIRTILLVYILVGLY